MTDFYSTKVWADWKSKTKKKALAIRHHARGTGGGPASGQALSASDERVLAIMGTLAVAGQDSVEELGFNVSTIIHLQGSCSMIYLIVSSRQMANKYS